MERIGEVAALWRYPVKGLAAEPLTLAEVEPGGFAGDRQQALLVRTAGHAREGKPYRGKENNRLHLCAGPDDAAALAVERGVALEAFGDGPYFDLCPVSVIFDSWIREAEALCGLTLHPLRFRPNVLIRCDAGAVALREADIVGSELAAGGIVFRATRPIERCVTISYDLPTGTAQPHVQRAIVQQRANVMGVYCDVVRAGTLRAGDSVECALDSPPRVS